MTKTRVRRATPRAQAVETLDSQEGWPITEEPRVALGEPEIGLDQNDFYRWRRNRSEPPPAFESRPRARR
jgi:hypothetical protein